MRCAVVALLGLVLSVTPALAQDADQIELKGVVGTAGFLDSPTDYHFAVGGAARVRVSRVLSVVGDRLWLGPEFRFGWEPIVRITVSVGYSFR